MIDMEIKIHIQRFFKVAINKNNLNEHRFYMSKNSEVNKNHWFPQEEAGRRGFWCWWGRTLWLIFMCWDHITSQTSSFLDEGTWSSKFPSTMVKNTHFEEIKPEPILILILLCSVTRSHFTSLNFSFLNRKMQILTPTHPLSG